MVRTERRSQDTRLTPEPKGDGAEEGNVDMAVRRAKRDQREQAAQDQGDPALDIE